MGILQPQLRENAVTVATVMNSPGFIETKILELVESGLIVEKFFSPASGPVIGGGLVYHVVRTGDQFLADDVVERAPGDEYAVVETVEPESRMALVRDFGGKFLIEDERITRNTMSYLNLQVLQLANTIQRKLNRMALAAVDAALATVPGGGMLAATAPWANTVTVGPLDAITPNAERPIADLVRAQHLADEHDLGIRYDTLVVAPQQAADLRIVYGTDLDQALAAMGIELVVSPYVQGGTAYVLQAGTLGRVGFERPFTVERIEKRENRATVVQAFILPSFAVEQPAAVTKIVGIEP